ncbi:DNA-processing protein DprA [Acidovorax sp.]|uniref:DNA-processing protein DprA n=1 Tax=Acidovorax sp. TaxID=1872122 RepID=UPI00391A4B09
MDREELGGWLRLTLSPGVGNGAARRLLARFGLPLSIFAQPEAALRVCVTAAQARALCEVPPTWAELLETTLQWLGGSPASEAADAPARAVVTLGDPRYPQALLDTEDPPLLLYLVGPRSLLQGQPFPRHNCLAIVGSRNPTAQGADNARQFARALHGAGLTIVSGLALGVDAAAHEGALDASAPGRHGSAAAPATIAVVGTGLDRVYPRKNLDLARRIATQGLLVSEYPLGTPPLPANFPKRNRIISGLSQGTLVVEAALASGSLITARTAIEQGREVFAIPGSIHAPQSRGCHALIRQGAKLVESAQDVLEELRMVASEGLQAQAGSTQSDEREEVEAEGNAAELAVESPLLQALGFDPVGIDALVARTGMDAASLQVALLELELEGRVARLPGGLFQRIGAA